MAIVLLLRLVWHEVRSALWSPWFAGLLVLGLCILIPAALSAGRLAGMPVHPRTDLMLEVLRGPGSIVLLIVVVLYSGELLWKDRAVGLRDVVDSMPVPNGVYLFAKLLALALLIAVFLVVGAVALIGLQLWNGHRDIALSQYAVGLGLAAVHPLLLMVLGCFCHVVARSKLVGYGLLLLFLLGWDLLEEFGFEHHLYRFASLPPTPYSGFGGYEPSLQAFGWYSLYWALAALLLVAASSLLWQRGTENGWRARFRAVRAGFHGPVRTVAVLGAIGFVASGAWIFHNTNVRNTYVPSPVAADRRADYEKRYLQYQALELPRIISVRAKVDIFPERRAVAIRGTYRLENRSGVPQRDLHVSLPDAVQVIRFDLPAHELVRDDAEQGYRIYRLRTPLQPREVIDVRFEVGAATRGFTNSGAAGAIVPNGTYFNRRDFFPVIGYDATRQLTDPEERRQRGLEPVRELPDAAAAAARNASARASDADRIDFEATVSTGIDQIALTSGELQREWVSAGRRYFHYRAEVPISHLFAFLSARYVVARSHWNGIAIEVYHHPGHGANVARMLDAARKSLAYCVENFGPYPHRSLRIVEFPAHSRDEATSFPGLVAVSERFGFNARIGGNEAIDFPFYITAHEVSHQWWGHQLLGANAKGIGVLHESLAQYSALMIMERDIGRDGLRPVLAHELDRYLRGRARERGTEPPLALAGRQEYVYYHKGALAMLALRDAMGEDRLNAALAALLSAFGNRGPPYATTSDLLSAIRGAAPREASSRIDDLFGKVLPVDDWLDIAPAAGPRPAQ